jgi:hypothetical protein
MGCGRPKSYGPCRSRSLYKIWPRHHPRRLPHQRHAAATSAPCCFHVTATSAPHDSHLAPVAATSSSTLGDNSSLRVMWRVDPWRSPSSQILGFGLGSMGFPAIYDGLRTSWIMLIYDKNVSSSLHLIFDAQYITFWNFIIDVVLWRNCDDPWRKSIVVDRRMLGLTTLSSMSL